jgi:6-phosphogluconolactonase (cycloisomerase 2 family)
MFYIVGSKEKRESWESGHQVPYFEVEEADSDVSCLHDLDGDEKATLFVNLNGEVPLYTVQVAGEKGEIASEVDYPSYDDALSAYEAANGRSEG